MERGDSIQVINSGESFTLIQKQDAELRAWIDEFLGSEEYAEALARSLQERGEGEEVAHGVHDGSECFEDVYVPEKNPKSHRGLVFLNAKVQSSLEKLQIQKTIANQLAGVAIIRKKIAEVKRAYKAREERKQFGIAEERMRTLSMLEKAFGITLSSHELTPTLLRKVQLRIADANANKSKLANKVKILKKIVREMRKDPYYAPRKRQWRPKRKAVKKRTRKDREAISEKQINSDENTMSPIESVLTLKNAELQELPYGRRSEGLLNTQNYSSRCEKPSRLSLNEPETTWKTRIERKWEISSQTSVTVENVFPSYVPVVNVRKKVKPTDVINQLLIDFHNLHKYLDTKKKLEDELSFRDDINLPSDDGFFCHPAKVIFKDFEARKTYRKSISLVNGNSTMRNIRFYHIVWNSDIQEELLMYVEPCRICKVKPGLPAKMTLRFTPETLAKTIDGKIVFITEDTRLRQRYRFVINFVCVPLCAAVTIDPIVISFEETPIWRARLLKSQGKNYKFITITNTGMKECKVVISKIFNSQTIEQEWKKIIGIIRIEMPESTPSLISSSTLEDPSSASPFPRDLVQQCVENVFNTFMFERNIFTVPPRSKKAIKCWFKDMCEPRYQAESFTFSIYERFPDGQLYCVGTQDVIVNSETTSHFLSVSVEILDFELCAYGTVYQLDFDVTNPCKISHHIQICFAPVMKRYLHTNQGSVTIQPNQKASIYIKFLPQFGILQNNKFYDEALGLLEFPIYIRTITKGFEDTPALKINAFAVVTISKGISFLPIYSPMVSCTKNAMVIDLGTCTTTETISTSLTLINSSLVPQYYGFLNVPEYITLKPNYGFGRLLPMSKAVLEIEVRPEKSDMMNKSGDINCSLNITTVKHCGGLKKELRTVDLSHKSKEIENYVYKSSGSSCSKLKEDLKALNHIIKHNPSDVRISEATSASLNRLSQVLEKSELFSFGSSVEEESTTPTEDLYEHLKFNVNLAFTVQDPLVQFSYQTLAFPNTPCGSWSIMDVDLCARKWGKNKYRARFEISGESDEFRVQPNCGDLQPEGKQKICIVIKPKLPQVIIEGRQKLIDDENFKKKSVEVVHGENTVVPDKKRKASKSKLPKTKESITKQAKVSSVDLCRDEKVIWDSFCPYMMEKTFKCRLSYRKNDNSPLQRSSEEISLHAMCQVVQPSFIHDQKLQIIDFGEVPVGSKATREINFQNIKQNRISIEVSPMNPVGSFYSPIPNGATIPSESMFSYPILFRPFEEKQEIEFIDACHDGTIYTFLIRGVGVQPNIGMNPDILVCRLSAPIGGNAAFAFELLNNHEIQMKVKLSRLCLLEGRMIDPSERSSEKQVNKKDKTKPAKKAKREKFSNELFDDEIYAIENNFEKSDQSSLFEVKGNGYVIPPFGKQTITICFGEKRGEEFKGTATKSKKSSKLSLNLQSNLSQSNLGLQVNHEQIYICKYNIFLNEDTFLRDLIVIGSFS